MKLNCVYGIVECFICMRSIAIKHMGAIPNGKLFAKSFLFRWITPTPRRTGNYSQVVSYWAEAQCPHAEQETIRKQFPTQMKRSNPTSDKKLFANSFLLNWNTMSPRRTGNHSQVVSYWTEAQCPPCRIGNYSLKVSYSDETPWPHIGPETIRK